MAVTRDNILAGLAGTLGRIPGQGASSFVPTAMSTAPNIDLNSQGGMAFARAGGSMGAGWVNQGAKAFLDGDLSGFDFSDDNNIDSEAGNTADYLTKKRNGEAQFEAQRLSGLAGKLGYDLSGYDFSKNGKVDLQYNIGDRMRNEAYKRAGITSPYETKEGEARTTTDLFEDLNKDLSKYARVRQASAGWDGKGNARSTAETLYYEASPGNWVPVTDTKFGTKAEHKGWAREEGAETLTALSIIAGGYLGGTALAGMGAGAGAAGGAAGGATAGAGTSGVSGAIANGLGLGSQWGALPAWGQSAISGAIQGGVRSGISGGNVLTGALMGGLGGGLTSGISGGLQGMGVDATLAGLGGRLGSNLISGSIGSAMNGGTSPTSSPSKPSASTGSPGASSQAVSASGGGVGGVDGVGGRNAIIQALLAQSLRNGPKRAGDVEADNPLTRLLGAA